MADEADPIPPAPANPELPAEIRAQLRPVAESMAPLFGGDVALAEEALVQSALELTSGATVLQYAPVLAARRARRRRDAFAPRFDDPSPSSPGVATTGDGSQSS